MTARDVTPDLDTLAQLFYPSLDALGQFEEILSADVPPVYRVLLDHEHHMTVTVEVHHGSPVDVRVLDKRLSTTHYARKILLVSQRTQQIVQYGIMRVNFRYLNDKVRREIEAEDTPLGRVLIKNDVHRQVHLASLWRVEPADELRGYFGMAPGEKTYGRTALIDCNGEPAVELLEIVAPA